MLEADEVYVIYSQLTEPYVFQRHMTGDDGYYCRILILSTSRWYHHYKETFDSQPNTQVRDGLKIQRTSSLSLGSAFYLNGALGITS